MTSQNVNNIKLTIISYGNSKSNIINKYSYLEEIKDSLTVIGNINQPKEVIKELTKHDLLIVTSKCRETGPLIILEALGNNIPVICNDLHGNKEFVINGTNGYIYKHSEPNELINILKDICNNPERINNLRNGSNQIINNSQRTSIFLKYCNEELEK